MPTTRSSIPILPLGVPWNDAYPRRLYISHLKARWFVYLFGLFGIVVTDLVSVGIPKSIQWLLDLLTGRPIPQFFTRATTADTFSVLFVTLVSALGVQVLGRRLWRLNLGQETHRATATYKSALWDRARFYPKERLEDDLSVGSLMNSATSDVSSSRLIFGWTLLGLFDFMCMALFATAAMYMISPRLTGLALIPSVLIPFLAFRTARLEYVQHATAQEGLSQLNELTSQAVATIRLQRLTQTGKFWQRRLIQGAAGYRLDRLRVIKTSLLFLILVGLPTLTSILILFYFGIPSVMNGSLSVGQFVAMHGFVAQMQFALTEIGFVISEWQRGMSSLARLSELLRLKPASGLYSRIEIGPSSSIQPTIDPSHLLSVKDLHFTYPGGRQILSGVTFDLAPGDRLGVSGPVGTGKSTLIQIIAGFERNFRGNITYLGRDLQSYLNRELRQTIAIVEQKPFLFADTIRSNLLLNRQDAEDALWHVLEVAGIADDVAAFPKKLDTPLGEWGVNLSGGQKQRLTIARALLAKPKLLLLDDCLSAVDTITEERILKSLDKHLSGTTLIWAAHRTSTLRFCSKFISLSHGDKS
jgi:ATP-binding cassette subfamily B multidrug efflux pump